MPHIFYCRIVFRFESPVCLIDASKGLLLEDGQYMSITEKALATPEGVVYAIGSADPYAPINMDFDPLARIWNAALFSTN